ncbi:MAG: hypothetical protein C0468_01830 [Planctomyces sp.]|nr:hypothetical protein [Planctomyces sp.]
MILFPLYAAIVWAVAFAWRRTWAGALAVIAGSVAIVVLTRALQVLGLGGGGFLLLLIAESVVVGGIGLAIVLSPRRPDFPHCHRCGHDLRGLDGAVLRCPECGTPRQDTPEGRVGKPAVRVDFERAAEEAGVA